MSRIIALDTETTGLNPDVDEIFEVAAVDCVTGEEWLWRLQPTDFSLAQMHPRALEVNKYWDRVTADDWVWNDLERSLVQMRYVLDRSHIVGAVPDFDTRFLSALFYQWGQMPPNWHYHLIDVEALAIGWLIAERLIRPGTLRLPMKSDDLSWMCGIEPPDEETRHTAMGDARWVRDLFNAITGGAEAAL